MSAVAVKLRDEKGIGLVELLISLLVLNFGIFATMGAFTSGAVAVRHASRVSTAAALADKKIEAFRQMAYTNPSFAVGTTTANQTGADGLTYSVTTAITSGSQLTTGSYQGSANVKVVTLTISSLGRVVYGPASTTFSQCANDMTTSACGGS